MTVRIDSPTAQPLASSQGGPAAQSESDVGLWHGTSVQVAVESADLLTDAAEEISFSHSEHVEARKLEEREIEEPPPLELPPVDSILAYLEAAGQEDPQERLKQFVDELKRKATQDHNSDPQEEARRRFGEVTEQYLALAFAAQALAGSDSFELLNDKIRTALEELDDDFGPHVRADLNTIGPAGEFGQGDTDRTAAFQSSYRDAVLGGQDLVAMLKGALGRFGENDYRGAVQHLIKALGDDLTSIRGSSAEPARLNAVLQDLYSMEVLATMLEGCQKLTARMAAQHGVTVSSAGELLQDLVSASGERWSNSSRFASIADKYGATIPPSSRVAFLGGVKALVRDLPLKTFADADARSNVLDAAQGALDTAITLEEES